ncbi:MAG: DUF1292 domain-containing protein [Clostridia bacterium]|nr:DUF1292 domain-containing protein [Clostridia bacterium]
MEEREMNQIDKILDENNEDNIFLYDEDDNELEFEQEAVIPMDGSVYVILVPVTPMDGVGEDEGVVFVIEEDEDGEAVLSLVIEDEIIDAVFDEYDGLLAEDGE